MDTERPTPFKCHVFVCVNDRDGERLSCADTGGKEIKDKLNVTLDGDLLGQFLIWDRFFLYFSTRSFRPMSGVCTE